MYRLLLVDDEREIVDWLYELFQDVEDLELDVYKALSGAEALQILGMTKIDVVVSDIKMPGINGLQLLERIRSRWTACRVIFLTGYNEFEYVYQAIQYEGVSYLLKTEEDSAIIGLVRKAVADLDRSANDRAMIERVQQYMGIALPSIQREVIKHIILDPEGGRGSTQEHLDEMQIPLRRDRPLYLAAGRFDRMPEGATPAFGVRMAANLRLKAEELFGSNFAYVNLIHQSSIDLVWLLQPLCQPDNRQEDCDRLCAPLLGGILESLQDFSRMALRLTTSYAFLSKGVPWEETESGYSMVAQMLTASSSMGGDAIFNERNFMLSLSRRPVADASAPDRRCYADLKAMPAMVDRGDRDAFRQAFSGIAEYLALAKGRNNGAAQELYYTVASMLLAHINRYNLAEMLAPGMDLGRLMRADMHADWREAAGYLRDLAAAVFDLRNGAQETNLRESVERIQQYIREHLSEDLSLVRLAEVTYFNPSYLSRLFKQAAGQNLTDYISGLRIVRAKELLRDYGRKIGDISASLGYESQHYFSRFFKKYTGMTPQEYRESIRFQ